MSFQPVSGFGADTGRNPNGPFRARTIPNRPYLRAIRPRVNPVYWRFWVFGRAGEVVSIAPDTSSVKSRIASAD